MVFRRASDASRASRGRAPRTRPSPPLTGRPAQPWPPWPRPAPWPSRPPRFPSRGGGPHRVHVRPSAQCETNRSIPHQTQALPTLARSGATADHNRAGIGREVRSDGRRWPQMAADGLRSPPMRTSSSPMALSSAEHLADTSPFSSFTCDARTLSSSRALCARRSSSFSSARKSSRSSSPTSFVCRDVTRHGLVSGTGW